MKTPKLFLTDYASYNQGTQFEFGHWIDLANFSDVDALYKYIRTHFAECDRKSPLQCGGVREEIMITDFENMPRELYGECGNFEQIFDYIEAIVDSDYEDHIIEAYISCFSIQEIGKIDDRFYMDLSNDHNIDATFGEHEAELMCLEIPENVQPYFDYESYGRDALYSYAQHNGVIFLNH